MKEKDKFEKEDATEYGEFVPSFDHWVTPDEQRKIVKRLEDLTEKEDDQIIFFFILGEKRGSWDSWRLVKKKKEFYYVFRAYIIYDTKYSLSIKHKLTLANNLEQIDKI